jgi:uncharacterized repeat protein (TIGR02543 family)
MASITVTTATMTIMDSTPAAVGAVENLTIQTTLGTPVTTNGTRNNLPAGVYTVVFKLEGTDAGEPKEVVWNELMYIFGGDTSDFTHTFDDDYFYRTHWNVTLNYDANSMYNPASGITYSYGAGMTITAVTQSVMHGGKLNGTGGVLTPGKPGYGFDGWFTKQAYDPSTDEWDVSNDPVHDDMTLYAGWTANEFTLTLTVETIKDPAEFATLLGSFVTNPIEISRGATTPTSQNMTVSGTYNAVKWEIDGVGAYTGQIITGTGPNFSINALDTKFNTPGGHVLRLTVTIGTGADAKDYRVNIPFTIID